MGIHPNSFPLPHKREVGRIHRPGGLRQCLSARCAASNPPALTFSEPTKIHAELPRCLAANLSCRFCSERPQVRPLCSRAECDQSKRHRIVLVTSNVCVKRRENTRKRGRY